MGKGKKGKLGELLIQMGLITPEQLEEAIQYQRSTGHKLGTCLITLGAIKEKQLVKALTSKTEIKSRIIGDLEIPAAVRSLIPVKKAFSWEALPLEVKVENGTKYLLLGMTDPSNDEIIKEVQFLTNCKVVPFLVGLEDLQNAYERIYHERMTIFRAPDDEIPNEITLQNRTQTTTMEIVSPATWSMGRRVIPGQKPPPYLPGEGQNDPYDFSTHYEISNIDERLTKLEKMVAEILEVVKKRG